MQVVKLNFKKSLAVTMAVNREVRLEREKFEKTVKENDAELRGLRNELIFLGDDNQRFNL